MKILIFALLALILLSCTSEKKISILPAKIETGLPGMDQKIEVEFHKGKSFNYPSFALWIEDLGGNYIETLYVTRFVATGTYGHGEIEPGKWKPDSGVVRRPASLPYWSHKRGIRASDGLFIPSPETRIPDALTAATPKNDFVLQTGTSLKDKAKFRILFEINQPWDSNEFWNNAKYPGDNDYFTSLQPALVYAVTVDPDSGEKEFFLHPIGHSHPSGKDGRLYTDITTLTTALNIAQKIVVRIK